MKNISHFIFVIFLLYLAMPSISQAQEHEAKTQKSSANLAQIQVRVADANTLRTDSATIVLWGTERIETGNAGFRLKARTALSNMIGGRPVQCGVMARSAQHILAQCSNHQGADISLFMIQNGYLIVDRSVVYNSVFEDTYITAETQAQEKKVGLWGHSENETLLTGAFGVNTVIILSLFIFLLLLGAFSVASMIMLHGFKKVVAAQDRNTDFLSKERILVEKEKNIVASMLEAELKSNQSKIEAYLIVYEETLKTLKDKNIDPKYKKSGDIVQVHPALDRSVFDGNTDKMDLLGRHLSSAIIHFYARIKTNPDYVNLEPDMPLDKAMLHVEKAVSNAQILNQRLAKVLDAFSDIGLKNTH